MHELLEYRAKRSMLARFCVKLIYRSHDVLNSCRSIEQLEIAKKYIVLTIKKIQREIFHRQKVNIKNTNDMMWYFQGFEFGINDDDLDILDKLLDIYEDYICNSTGKLELLKRYCYKSQDDIDREIIY